MDIPPVMKVTLLDKQSNYLKEVSIPFEAMFPEVVFHDSRCFVLDRPLRGRPPLYKECSFFAAPVTLLGGDNRKSKMRCPACSAESNRVIDISGTDDYVSTAKVSDLLEPVENQRDDRRTCT